jgi:hypothetical protein
MANRALGPISDREGQNSSQRTEMPAADGSSTIAAAGDQHDGSSDSLLVWPRDRFS